MSTHAGYDFAGGYSWFQFLATIIIIAPEIPAAMLAISPILIGRSEKSASCLPESKCDSGNNNSVPNVTRQGFFGHTSINEEV